jgi:hypothetical protein
LQRVSTFLYLSLDGMSVAENASFTAPIAQLPNERTTTPSKVGVATFGAAVQAGPRRGNSGPFAEVAFALVHAISYQTQFAAGNALGTGCGASVKTAGNALRFATGWSFPIAKESFNLSPYLGWEFGSVASTKYTPGNECSEYLPVTEFKQNNSPLHSLIGLGVAGQLLIGR